MFLSLPTTPLFSLIPTSPADPSLAIEDNEQGVEVNTLPRADLAQRESEQKSKRARAVNES